MELGPSSGLDINRSGSEGHTKSLFKIHTKSDGFFTRCRYKLSRKRQFTQEYRILKPRNMMWPSISNNNKIVNTKYNILTFLPCFFYDQFKYFFNFYYLCLCMSQFYPPLKIGFLFTYIGPLAFVLFLSFGECVCVFQEFNRSFGGCLGFRVFNLAVDELSKYLRDLEVNSEKFRVLDHGREKECKSGDLEVGDIVLLKEGDRAPADLLIVATGTDQIDGETDLKIRKPCPVICDLLKADGSFLEAIDVEFVIPVPNQLIYKFEGAAHILIGDNIQKKISLDYENTLWGGCKVGKSSVIGVVIYNGEDSKMMMSAEEIEPKRSLLVDELNDLSKLLFFIMLILSVTIVALKGNQTNLFLQVFRYVLLLSTIIPISVKVNHDLSRLYYSSRINNDPDMPGCQARNSSVCEDLGRIKYILSDKTGTLTKNEMEMRKVFISTSGELTTNQYRNQLAKATSNNPGDEGLLEFNNCMMICHSVTPTIDERQERVLESASPDELSFITLMEECGFMLADKTDQSVVYNDQLGVLHKYKIEATFPFSSERKRMGVICSKEGQRDLIFYLKFVIKDCF